MNMYLNAIFTLLRKITEESTDSIFKKACISVDRKKDDLFQNIDEITERIQNYDMPIVYLSEKALGDFWWIFFNYQILFNDAIVYIQRVVTELENIKLDVVITPKIKQQKDLEMQKNFITIMLSLREIASSNKKEFISNKEFNAYIDKCNQLPKIADAIREKMTHLNEQNSINSMRFISVKLTLASTLSNYMLHVTENLSKQFDFDEYD